MTVVMMTVVRVVRMTVRIVTVTVKTRCSRQQHLLSTHAGHFQSTLLKPTSRVFHSMLTTSILLSKSPSFKLEFYREPWHSVAQLNF